MVTTDERRIDGRVDGVHCGVVAGWAWNPAEPDRRLEVRVALDGHEVGATMADLERPSLAAAGIGDGTYSFRFVLPVTLSGPGEHRLGVVAGGQPVRPAVAFGASVRSDNDPWVDASFTVEQPRVRSSATATVNSLRLSSIDLQRALADADAQRRALERQLERQLERAHVARQQLQRQLEHLTWRTNDRELTLREARELLQREQTALETVDAELQLALTDLRRTERSLSGQLGYRLSRARAGAGGKASANQLYAGLKRLDELEQNLRKRQRLRVSARPSRVGLARKKVTVVAWDLGHNPVGRARALAEIVGRSHDVEIVGPQFARYGSEIWAPMRDTEVPIRAITGSDLPQFVADAESLVRTLRTDLVFVSKPRFPSLLLAMLIKHLHGVPVILDVDDRELSFFDRTTGISLDELESQRAEPDFRLPFGETWTRACDALIADADAVTVSSRALQDVYGGTIVPHARNERLLNRALYDREALRAELGYTSEDRVLLFAGTPRAHKGLVELGDALQAIGDPRYKLCVVGSVSDAGLKRDLEAFGPDRVKLIESRPWSEVAAMTVIGDLVCLLQSADSEIARYQTPAKITEAVAMGVPVLARETPPIAPFIEAGAVQGLDERPLAEQIDALMSDPSAMARQAEQGRRYYLDHLSYAAVAATVDELIADLGDHLGEPSVNWRRAVDIARGPTAEKMTEPVDGGPPAGVAPAPAPSKRLVARGRQWDVVFFWKQNDSWIYGRRSDMLMKYLAESDRTRRLVHFDAPLRWDMVEGYRRRSRGAPGEQSALVYERARRQALRSERHGKLRSYTFIAQSDVAPSRWQRALLPPEDEYLGYIEHVLKRSGIGKRPLLFWVWPTNFEFPEIHRAFSPLLTVADVVDDQRSWINPGTSQYKALSSNYEEVLSLSDVVLANCAPVQERMRWFGADPVLIPNAMEVPRRPLYRRRAPAELRRLAGPIIGYVGNLGSRIDLPLLERIADERDDWQLVVIGSAHLSDDVLALDQRPNVHFLGVRRYPDVMRYIRSFDVAIIPHRDDALTRSMNPLKAYVYAGCGVPVVTTDVANLPDLGGGIRVAATHDEFILALGETIAQERSEACPQLSPEVIERHSWNQRVAQIERILDTAGAAVEAKSRTTT